MRLFTKTKVQEIVFFQASRHLPDPPAVKREARLHQEVRGDREDSLHRRGQQGHVTELTAPQALLLIREDFHCLLSLSIQLPHCEMPPDKS